MPRKLLMSPDFGGRHARWRKTYKGEPYSVTCAELGLPESQWTELLSYQAANEWWIAKRAKIDSKPPALRPDVQEIVDKLREKKRLLAALGGEAADYDAAIDTAIKSATTPLIDPKRTFASLEEEIDAVCAATIPPGGEEVCDLDPRTAARLAFLESQGVDLSTLDTPTLELALGGSEYWADKYAQARVVTTDRKIGTHFDAWLELKRASASVTSLESLEAFHRQFSRLEQDKGVVFSSEMSIDAIDEAKAREVYQAIAAIWGIEGTGKKKWDTFSNFVGYLAENKLIDRPANLDSKEFKFKIVTIEKPEPNKETLRAFITSLPDRLRLYALLAANTGMNNVDIAQLEWWTEKQPMPVAMLDLEKKIIRRKRVKTKTTKRVPTVVYSLWDETHRLLEQECSKTGPLVLLNADGQPLRVEDKGGGGANASHYDAIGASWRDYFRSSKKKKLYTLKDFRFTSSALIQNHETYYPYQEAFLGQSPKTPAGKNYSTSQSIAHVCKWLEQQYYPKPNE